MEKNTNTAEEVDWL